MKTKPKRTGAGGGGGGEDPFELCDVCKLNHDQGRRHKYFPSHVRSLSSLLSRFHKKIAALQSFLKSPAISQPERSQLDRIWCVFCGVDVGGSGSPFACGDVIYHLASSEHLSNLKDFLWKNGGGMDRVDSFRVSDDELIKWENGCKSLKIAASTLSEGAIRQLPASSKEMRVINCILKSLIEPYEMAQFLILQPLCQWACRVILVFKVNSPCSLLTMAKPYLVTL